MVKITTQDVMKVNEELIIGKGLSFIDKIRYRGYLKSIKSRLSKELKNLKLDSPKRHEIEDLTALIIEEIGRKEFKKELENICEVKQLEYA